MPEKGEIYITSTTQVWRVEEVNGKAAKCRHINDYERVATFPLAQFEYMKRLDFSWLECFWPGAAA